MNLMVDKIRNVSDDSVIGDSVTGNGLALMTLRGFIRMYSEELEDYYDEDFGTGDKLIEYDDSFGSMVLCMVDNKEDNIPQDIKRKIRKAGKFRRDKLKHQWSYINPLNRIHGYVILEDIVLEDKKVVAISTICSSYFSRKKGIGSDLMMMTEAYAREMGYTDIILEVANEYAGYAEFYNEEDEEDEEEEEEDEEDEEEDEEEEGWFPDENVLDILADEFWKKCMRKNQRQDAYYNIEKEYIYNSLHSYMYCEEATKMEYDIKEYSDDPGEYEYGGFWYLKGMRSQLPLMNFYKKFGYVEDKEVHNDWGCFSNIPYPSMRLTLL